MKSSKKTSLLILAMIVISLVCGYLGAGARGGGGGGGSESPSGDWIAQVKQRGELRVGVAAFPPMVTQNADGSWSGPMLLPLQQLAGQLKVKLTPVSATWGTIVAGLQANRYDIAAGLDVTLERSLSIQFADPFYKDPGVFVVRRDSEFATSEQILGAKQLIAASQGSAHEAAVKAAGATTLSVDTWPNAIQAVKDKRAIAEFTDLGTAEGQARADNALAIVRADPPVWLANVGFGLPAGVDRRSLDTINAAILMAQDSGQRDRAFEEVGYVGEHKLGGLAK
ncbi:substrate-binding periplasmic protein [Pseudonocardia acaciae]|uniref:substrate-binding periplasmic protein n=1 Tax=Pseudonocardia acaciae TaxID=551276 RepID=UPI00048FD75A|nr:transporter substrate-binding domain-containing protein [Pseudonocardia acaciae]